MDRAASADTRRSMTSLEQLPPHPVLPLPPSIGRKSSGVLAARSGRQVAAAAAGATRPLPPPVGVRRSAQQQRAAQRPDAAGRTPDVAGPQLLTLGSSGMGPGGTLGGGSSREAAGAPPHGEVLPPSQPASPRPPAVQWLSRDTSRTRPVKRGGLHISGWWRRAAWLAGACPRALAPWSRLLTLPPVHGVPPLKPLPSPPTPCHAQLLQLASRPGRPLPHHSRACLQLLPWWPGPWRRRHPPLPPASCREAPTCASSSASLAPTSLSAGAGRHCTPAVSVAGQSCFVHIQTDGPPLRPVEPAAQAFCTDAPVPNTTIHVSYSVGPFPYVAHCVSAPPLCLHLLQPPFYAVQQANWLRPVGAAVEPSRVSAHLLPAARVCHAAAGCTFLLAARACECSHAPAVTALL
jgi:hypothetical protein